MEYKRTEEIWKDIPGYEGIYQASTFGRIRSIPHLIKANKDGGTRYTNLYVKNPTVGWHGYSYIGTSKNGECKTELLHRLIAKTFLPNPNNLPAVNHKDGNKQNNYIENLEWCTDSENQMHTSINGLFKKTKKVKCVETGAVYRNSCDAEKQTGVSSRTIRNVCAGIGNTAGGYKWIWA